MTLDPRRFLVAAVAAREAEAKIEAMARPEDLEGTFALVRTLARTMGLLGALEEVQRRVALGWRPATPVKLAGWLPEVTVLTIQRHSQVAPMVTILSHVLQTALQEGTEPVGTLSIGSTADLVYGGRAITWTLDPIPGD